MRIEDDTSRLQRARKSRDARFDGLFFVAVRTTGIYCRPICPASPPLEKNVEYHDSALSAAQAGFRPCLRCRPDSAPQSCAWRGTQTTFQRALALIDEGALQDTNVMTLAARLGISDRYLRNLFQDNLGASPKQYAIYQQCLFAKQLLHQSCLSISDIAFAAGFNSVRRFNEAMQAHIGLAPREIRKVERVVSSQLVLKLHYRPPFCWQQMLDFLRTRKITGLEWCDDDSYGRTIEIAGTRGRFDIRNKPAQNHLQLTLMLNDYAHLNRITQRVRKLFDVDAAISEIDLQLSQILEPLLPADKWYQPGLRIPGIWDTFEAGVRAILGQQVSVAQAMNLVTLLVHELGEDMLEAGQPDRKLFPTPAAIADSELPFLKMPGARKQTLHNLAAHYLASDSPDQVADWKAIKGIGPWTTNYARIRGSKDPDVWLAGDAGIKNALRLLSTAPNINDAAPWRSYLTFQLWNLLHQPAP